ncbi:unnamed protein product, partial [Iphiclides podalirius]
MGCGVLISPSAMFAARGRLKPDLIQIITETSISGNYACKSISESTSSTIHPGFEYRKESSNNAFSRITLFTEPSAPHC